MGVLVIDVQTSYSTTLTVTPPRSYSPNILVSKDHAQKRCKEAEDKLHLLCQNNELGCRVLWVARVTQPIAWPRFTLDVTFSADSREDLEYYVLRIASYLRGQGFSVGKQKVVP